MFIDVHCHLDMFDSIGKIVANAKKKDVKLMVAQGTDVESNRKVLEFASNFKEIKAALGIYPINALAMKEADIEKEIKFIKQNRDKIVAIGEVGLDLKDSQVELFDKQQRVFQYFIDLAIELNVPIIVHSRKAELQSIIQLEQSNAKKVIMHCFSGKLLLAKRIAENNWHLSIPTSVKNSEHFQKVIEQTPIEQLLCETDSPYLHPDKLYPNEPCNVTVSYEMIAKLKNLKLKDVEKQLEDSYKKLFLE